MQSTLPDPDWPDLTDGVVEPVPRALQRDLRRTVLDHATSQHRRVFPPVLHLGVPGGHVASCPLEPPFPDPALTIDVIEALGARWERRGGAPTGPRLLWLTRRGELTVQDVDLACLAAAQAAAREQGLVLPLVVVTRRGWHDPRTGVHRTWTRIRAR